MKKILLALTAIALAAGTINAQSSQSFKAAAGKATTKNQTKTEVTASKAKAETQATQKSSQSFKAQKTEKADKAAKPAETRAANGKAEMKSLKDAPRTKQTDRATRSQKATTARPVDTNTFNGVWANSYGDGIGGTVTDYLTLNFDPTTGTAKGEYKDENGNVRHVSGKLKGKTLVCVYDADGDEFAEINIINDNTLKLEGFTGTFKRVKDTNAVPAVDNHPSASEAAPVDPAFEEVKRYLEGD